MKKAVLNPFYGIQALKEVSSLSEIEEIGTYAVSGCDKPVNVQLVTEYGAEQIRRQYPQALFFTGADGECWVGIKTGEFAE